MTLESPPTAVAEMLKNACYHCHSNHTKYPRYTSVQPVGWWIRGHYRGARQNVNLSEWASYTPDDKAHALEEMAEVVEKKEMPMKSYTWMHPDGSLSDAQRTELAAWFRSKAGG